MSLLIRSTERSLGLAIALLLLGVFLTSARSDQAPHPVR